MAKVDDQTWKLFEMYIWNNSINSYSIKHRILIIFSFAKVQKGSLQLWEFLENIVLAMEGLKMQDINFICW
jgi:hypothetical protein